MQSISGGSTELDILCYVEYLTELDINSVSAVLAACVLRATTKKRSSTFLRQKVHPGDLAGRFSDLELTWLLYCAGATSPPLLEFRDNDTAIYRQKPQYLLCI